jgi:hypothetical protein
LLVRLPWLSRHFAIVSFLLPHDKLTDLMGMPHASKIIRHNLIYIIDNIVT